jgi:hypothetical protein
LEGFEEGHVEEMLVSPKRVLSNKSTLSSKSNEQEGEEKLHVVCSLICNRFMEY